MITKQYALVTGASRGIGAAIAKQLIQDGFYVIGTATSSQGAEAINHALGNHGEGFVLNVKNNAEIEALFNHVEDQKHHFAVVVNNAGITKDGLLMRMNEADWDEIIDVHLNAVYKISKRALKGMAKARFGRIINISSVVAQMGNAGQTNYVAAKAGIEGFSRALAKEMGSRNITVNCVAPGMIQTDMTHELPETQKAQLLQQIALNKFGEAQDIANAVSFLASNKANYITGIVLPVNGGLHMR